MTDRPVRRRALRAALLASIAGTAVAAACAVPGPNTVAGPANAPSASAAAPAPGPVQVQPDQAFFEFQVEQPVVQVSGVRAAYPAAQRAAGVGGQVIAQFVVDTAGRVEPASIRIIESTHDAFTAAVREAIPGSVFQPAEIGGRKVRQLVQQPFVFRVPGDTTPPAGVQLRRSPAPTATDTTTVRLNDTTLLRRVRPASAPPAAPPRDGAAFFEFQIERPATIRTNVAPTYPAALQAEGVSGRVIASFVVDTTGRVLEGSMRVIESDHALFTAAVAAVLPRLEFEPARVENGRPVRQLIQQAFTFNVDP